MKKYFSTFVCVMGLSAYAEPDRLSQADTFLEASLYEEAIMQYQIILQESHEAVERKFSVQLKLAQAYLAKGLYAEAVVVLEAIPSEGLLAQQKWYLLGLVYKYLGEVEKAKSAFVRYLCCEADNDLYFFEEVQYELGLCHFLTGDLKKARSYFETLNQKDDKKDLYFLSQIYQAKIDLAEMAYEHAEKRLVALSGIVPPDHLLRYEIDYWLGEAFYQQKNYPKACERFERSLPSRNVESAGWYTEALYALSLCYFKIGEEIERDFQKKKNALEKAKKSLEELVKIKPNIDAYLTLAKIYLSLSNKYQDPESSKKLEEILSRQNLFVTLESQANVLWLKGEIAPDYKTKNDLYRKLTDEAFKNTSLYPYSWFSRGLNDFNEGMNLIKKNEHFASLAKFDVACYAFDQAFHLLNRKDQPKAGMAIRYLAEAYLHSSSQEAVRKAFLAVDQLINNDGAIIASMADPSEMYYLHASLAARLTSWQPGDIFAEAAERSLRINIEHYADRPFAKKSLYFLGIVLYHKKNYAESEKTLMRFSEEETEQTNVVGDAYFWIAKSLDKQKKEEAKSKTYKKMVFEKYATSDFAAEAYFTYYTLRDYLQGDRIAVKHLLDFEKNFPNSPFLITAHYLIGLDYKRDRKTAEGKWIRKKNLMEAIQAFQDGESTFDKFFEKQSLPPEEFSYFVLIRYHCTLERALANLGIAEQSQGAKRRIFLDYAEEVFKQIVTDFQDQHHSLTKSLLYREPYPRLLEESSYWLAQTYIKAENDNDAEHVLSEMLENYRLAKTTRGYFLSRARYDLGMIAVRKKNYSQALELLLRAEDAAKGKVLTVDQKIDLWIQQSSCYRELGEWDKAMLLLSKAINDDTISSLRIKAMYLRAEIYTLQGRHELARKQLEAASKNRGEWALKAKQKLDEEYGYQ